MLVVAAHKRSKRVMKKTYIFLNILNNNVIFLKNNNVIHSAHDQKRSFPFIGNFIIFKGYENTKNVPQS